MTEVIYDTINYEEIKNKAYDFLIDYADGLLPIKLTKMIEQIDNLMLLKYSDFAKMHKIAISEAADLLQSDDGALWYDCKREIYILLYNDTITNKERIRFTIAHELGHYALKHNEKTEKTIVSRYSLPDSEYDFFEREANFFAKHLLVPFPVLGNYTQLFHSMSNDFIQEIFDVSYTVACYVIDNLKKMYSFGLVKEAHKVEKKFADYIKTDKTTIICDTCNCKIQRDSLYCHICGAKLTLKEPTVEAFLNNKNKERINRMKYKKIELDSEGYPVHCPRCDNEEVGKDNYCDICGTYIKNICIGDYDDNFDSYGYPLHINNFLDNGCHKELKGNSRYCPSCGGKSSYFFQGLLKNWDLEKEEYEDDLF